MHFAPDDLRKLGDALEKELSALFKQARYKLDTQPRDVQPDNYTTFGYSVAATYTQVIEFVDQDLIDKTKAAMDANDRLHRTAATQDESEAKSTLNGAFR
ncbi:hypothetical protein [Actinomadura gamaensis]|uniref:Excreted virulence factor EspC (Type VII ESX diderm) n=1 Tax=Actinomadura gamaensis TaxID=1763541 RepID=A0ABV9U9K0_9ACTN